MGYNPQESLENTLNTMSTPLGVHPIVPWYCRWICSWKRGYSQLASLASQKATRTSQVMTHLKLGLNWVTYHFYKFLGCPWVVCFLLPVGNDFWYFCHFTPFPVIQNVGVFALSEKFETWFQKKNTYIRVSCEKDCMARIVFFEKNWLCPLPIGSMYGIFTDTDHKN